MSDCGVPRCDSTSAVRGHGVCDDCWSRRGRALTAIPPLWAKLHEHLPPAQSGMSDVVTHSTVGSRLPLNGAVLNALQGVPMTLMAWANWCRHLRDQQPLPLLGKRWGFVLAEAVKGLEAADEELHYTESGVDYLTAVFDAHGQTLALAGGVRLVHRLFAACPECSRRDLWRHNGEDAVRCHRCGANWAWPTYQQLVVVQARAVITQQNADSATTQTHQPRET